MYPRNRIATLAGVVVCGGVLLVGAGAVAVAERENDAVTDLRAARLSLVEAIALAEAQLGGRAVAAELDSKHGAVSYEIELVDGTAVRELRLDAITGAVISSRDDESDADDDEDDACGRD